LKHVGGEGSGCGGGDGYFGYWTSISDDTPYTSTTMTRLVMISFLDNLVKLVPECYTVQEMVSQVIFLRHS